MAAAENITLALPKETRPSCGLIASVNGRNVRRGLDTATSGISVYTSYPVSRATLLPGTFERMYSDKNEENTSGTPLYTNLLFT